MEPLCVRLFRIPDAAGFHHASRAILAAVSLALVTSPEARAESAPTVHGLPFARFYAYDEIGNEARGARLDFDPLGRLSVTQNGAYVVLNDTAWTDIADKSAEGSILFQVVKNSRGLLYYCATGSWGTIDYTPEGKVRPHSVLPAAVPPWVKVTNFNEIIPDDTGMFISGWNGVVHWNPEANEHAFFEIPQVSRTFLLNGRIFVSSLTDGIQRLDLASRSLERLEGPGIQGQVLDMVAPLNNNRVLVSTIEQRLMIFDGRELEPWSSELGRQAGGRISNLARLVDGNIAVAIDGQGVFILSEEGRILISLTSPEHHRVMDLVTREAGVLWIATESGIEKVLYNSPVTIVDQRLGASITWPQVVRWKDRTLIASNGELYETIPQQQSATASFHALGDLPAGGAWGIAVHGKHLLIGNAHGVYARRDDGGFVTILNNINVDRLVMIDPGLCYVIGAREITALRWVEGNWSECAARIPGVGYPTLVTATKKTAWIELGPNRAARVSFENGRLQTRVFDDFPWAQPEWIHISVVGDTVVLNGLHKGQIYFDESTGVLGPGSPLQRLFDQAPHLIARLCEDAEGILWASHEQGVFKIFPQKDGYRFDLTSLDIVKGRVPGIQIPDGSDVWLSSKHSLYHVDRTPGFETKPVSIKPVLVSVIDGRSGREIHGAMHSANLPSRLPYAQNSPTFRFFAGNYAWMRSPVYEFRMNGRSIFGTDSQLTLPDLREGAYHLDVRLLDTRGPVGEPLSVDFEIEPPWYRTWYAYIGYTTAGVLAMLGCISWAIRRTKSKNLALEWLVHERTEELRAAMHRLAEETSNAATLAERNRLAGEIHDSLQQGLSGLILQLEATLKLTDITKDVRSRLSVARNMVSFTRHEVQNAVWNLESPLLENADLGDALDKMAALISSGGPQIELQITGTPRRLSSSANHHLLRIAQEAITNSVRHGAANRISVLLQFAEDSVSLAVNDDGCGFVPQQALKQELGHFGLRGLRGRVDKMNGDIRIVSEPGHGASIKVSVPISA